MKRKLILTCGLILGLMLATVSVQADSDLIVPQTMYDFGFAPQNAKISHTFELYNSGDDSLKITKVVPGCGCTKTPLAKDQLAPKEKTSVAPSSTEMR